MNTTDVRVFAYAGLAIVGAIVFVRLVKEVKSAT